MPLQRKCHIHTTAASVKFSSGLRYKVKTTLSLQLNMCTLIRISCIIWRRGANVQIVKPTADKLVGWCTSLRHAQAVWLIRMMWVSHWWTAFIRKLNCHGDRMGAVGGLVTYSVKFAGTYIVYAHNSAGLTFVMSIKEVIFHNFFICLWANLQRRRTQRSGFQHTVDPIILIPNSLWLRDKATMSYNCWNVNYC